MLIFAWGTSCAVSASASCGLDHLLFKIQYIFEESETTNDTKCSGKFLDGWQDNHNYVNPVNPC